MADFAEKTADLYRIIADSSHDWECWHDTNLSLKYVSPSCQAVTGYTQDEFYRNPDLYFRIVHPEDLDKLTCHCSSVSKTANECELEFRVIRKDGAVCWISHFCRPIYDHRQRLLGRRSTNRDVTRLKELQEQLTESRKRLSGTLEAARAGVWQLDINTLRITADKNAVGPYGLSGGTTDAEILRQTIHPEDVEQVTAAVRNAIQEKSAFCMEFRTVQKDGRLRWVCCQGRYSEEDQGPQMCGLVWDVTETQQQKLELLRLQEELKKLAQFPRQNPDPVMQIADDGTVLYMNPAAAEMFSLLKMTQGNKAPDELLDSVRQAVVSGQRTQRYVPVGQRLIWLSFAPVQGAVNIYGRDFTQHKRSEDYFRLLSETAGLLLTAEEPQTVVNDFCTAVMRHLECDCFFNYLLDKNTNRLHLNACAGVDDATAGSIKWLDCGVAVCGTVARDKQRIVAEDIQHSSDPRTALIKSFGIQAYACHPLTGPGGHVIGTLSFGTRSRTAFASEDLSLMKTVTDLTATAMCRIQTQKALRDSQGDLNRAQAVIHLGSWRFNHADSSLQWSDETYRILGIPLGTPVSYDRFLEAVHPDDRAMVESQWSQALEGKPYECRHRILADGQIKWVHEKAELEFDSQGQLIDAFGTVQDITQAKMNADALEEAKHSLSESNQLLESVLNNTHVLVACMDPEFNFIRVNAAYANADGKPVEFFAGKNHFDLYPNAENEAIFRRVAESGEPYMVYARKFEYAGNPERGPSYWDWSLVPIRDDQGHVRQLVLTLADVTHQKLSEKMQKDIMRRQAAQVKASEEILKAESAESLLQTISQAALTVANAQVAVAESVYRKQVYSNAASGSELMPQWVPQALFKMAKRSVCREVVETGQSLRLTDEQLRAHPKWEDLPEKHIPVNGLVAAPLLDRLGQVSGIIMATCREQGQFTEEDETELRHLAAISSLALQHMEAREQLARERDLLEQRVRKRTADLERTVSTLGEEVLQRVKAESELQATNEELQRRAERLSRMASELTVAEHRERYRLAQVLHDHLQQLLVAAKLELSTVTRKITHAEPRKVLDSVMGLLKESINESRSLTVELYPPILHEAGLVGGLEWLVRWMQDKHGFEVELDVQGDVNIRREDICILLFQSIRELLFNTVKHSRVSKARLSVRRKGDFVQLTIRDEGIGFDPQKLQERTEKMNGGFGLFSIRERLTSLGGQLEIISAPQAGAQFILKAPADVALILPEKTPAAKRKIQDVCVLPEADGLKAAPIRVLLVDDHTIMRRGLATLLKQETDMQVVGEAADGSEAIRLARQLKPDVVLMDFSLPGMNGAEATQIICEETPTVQVIGLSMFDEQDRAAAMFEAGASAYASKSESPTILLTAIRSVAAKSPAGPADGNALRPVDVQNKPANS
jgi:PAS domain S-box-containing protein